MDVGWYLVMIRYAFVVLLTPLYLVQKLLEIRGNKFGNNVDIKQSERKLKSDKHEILSVDWYLNIEASKAPPDIKGTAHDHLAPENRFPKPVTVKRNNSMPVSHRSKHRYVVFLILSLSEHYQD